MLPRGPHALQVISRWVEVPNPTSSAPAGTPPAIAWCHAGAEGGNGVGAEAGGEAGSGEDVLLQEEVNCGQVLAVGLPRETERCHCPSRHLTSLFPNFRTACQNHFQLSLIRDNYKNIVIGVCVTPAVLSWLFSFSVVLFHSCLCFLFLCFRCTPLQFP